MQKAVCETPGKPSGCVDASPQRDVLAWCKWRHWLIYTTPIYTTPIYKTPIYTTRSSSWSFAGTYAVYMGNGLASQFNRLSQEHSIACVVLHQYSFPAHAVSVCHRMLYFCPQTVCARDGKLISLAMQGQLRHPNADKRR